MSRELLPHISITSSLTYRTTTAVALSIPASNILITHLCNSGFCHKRCTTFSSKCSGSRQRQWCACDNIVMYGQADVHVYVLSCTYETPRLCPTRRGGEPEWQKPTWLPERMRTTNYGRVKCKWRYTRIFGLQHKKGWTYEHACALTDHHRIFIPHHTRDPHV